MDTEHESEFSPLDAHEDQWDSMYCDTMSEPVTNNEDDNYLWNVRTLSVPVELDDVSYDRNAVRSLMDLDGASIDTSDIPTVLELISDEVATTLGVGNAPFVATENVVHRRVTCGDYEGLTRSDYYDQDDDDAETSLDRVVRSRYCVLRTLTPGSEGNVYVCRRPSSKAKSLMVVKAGVKGGTEVEARLLASVSHESVIKLLDVFRYGQITCIVMPYFKSDLYTYTETHDGCLSLIDAATVQRRILEALRYIHNVGIIHRDVKSENILLNTPADACLGDFGAACELSGGIGVPFDYGWAGTVEINSPEMLARDPYCESTDVWSAGIVLFEMLSRKISVFGMIKEAVTGEAQLREIIKRLQTHPEEFPRNESSRLTRCFSKFAEEHRRPYTVPGWIRKFELHSDAEYTICKMLTFDAARRPGVDELLTFPIFTNMNHLLL